MNLIEFPSKMFHFDATGHGSAEASDMGNRHLQRIYDDACDVGFTVRSSKTGDIVTYAMSSPFYQGDGEDTELAGWNFEPTSESIRKHPFCAGTKITVFND